MTRVNPSPARRIELQAYDGTPIPNLIGLDPSEWLLTQQRAFLQGVNMLGFREVRRAPTGRYNCHGLTFASRRTRVDNSDLPVDIGSLLLKDRYRQTPDPAPGDVVVYRSPTDDGSIEHSGVVLRIELGAVFVLSKWGDLEEYEHLVTACPYRGPHEFWTLRE